MACFSCQSQNDVAPLMQHYSTNPLQCKEGDTRHTGLARFQCTTNPTDCGLEYDGGSGGRGKQQDCLVTLSSGIHNTAVGVAINGLKLEQFYKLVFINAL